MKIKFTVTLALLALLVASPAMAGKPKNTNLTRHLAYLNGDGTRKLVEVEDKTATEGTTVVTVKNNKKGPAIDSFSIPGRIRKIEFKEFNFDQKQRIVVYFDGKDNSYNIVIYQFNNNKLSKVFSAESAYGIEADFDLVTRIKIGRASRHSKSPNLVPDWDTWLWTSDKFIKE